MQIGTTLTTKVIEWMVVLIVAVASFIFSIRSTISDVDVLKAENKDIKCVITQHDKSIAIIQNDLSYIRRGIDEIRGRR